MSYEAESVIEITETIFISYNPTWLYNTWVNGDN